MMALCGRGHGGVCALLAALLLLHPVGGGSGMGAGAPLGGGDGGGEKRAPTWLQSERLYKAERVALFLRGARASEGVMRVLRGLHELKKPNSMLVSRRTEDAPTGVSVAMIEEACRRDGASFVGFGSSTKRRPDNLFLARLFNGRILDSFDLALLPLDPRPPPTTRQQGQKPTATIGSTCSFVFLGADWQRDTRLSELKNLLVDALGVRHAGVLAVGALERVVVCSAINDTRVHFEQFLLDTAKSEQGEAVLIPSAPSFAFDIRACRLAETEAMRKALRLKDRAGDGREDKQKEREKRRDKLVKKRDKLMTKVKEEVEKKGGTISQRELDKAASKMGVAAKPIQTIDMKKILNKKKRKNP